MADQPTFPTLSDDEMRDSLELFATALAGMFERIDEQGKLLSKVNLRATEARSRGCWGAGTNQSQALRRADCQNR